MEHLGTLKKILNQDMARMPKIFLTDEPRPQAEFSEVLSAEDYHNDREAMSSGALRKILKSPRSFLSHWYGLDEEEDKDHFRVGRAAHLMLLEPQLFRKLYIIEPIFEGFTKKGELTTNPNAHEVKEAKRLWYEKLEKGALVLKQKELDDLVGMIDSVIEHPIASRMLRNGKPECSIKWVDPESGVLCRARPDYIVDDKTGALHLIDFKTTKDIREGIFANDVLRMMYHVQLAFYHDGIVQALGRQPTTITLIAVEKTAPFEAAVYPLDDEWFEQGQLFYKHALKLYAKCRETGIWPAYQKNAKVLRMPSKGNLIELPEFDFGMGVA